MAILLAAGKPQATQWEFIPDGARLAAWNTARSNWTLATSIALILLGTPMWWLGTRKDPHACPNCNYDLTATPPTSPCPECGTKRPAPAATHAGSE
ncbi:MAG: hypothetical protein ACKVZJ_05145 [Phycisphaerales bacterium]